MKRQIASLISSTPLYPHWLEFRTIGQLRERLIGMLHGDVIEVGAGDGRLKAQALASNRNIGRYIATDYSSWDGAFDEGTKLARSAALIDQLHMRAERSPLDRVCSALELPFADESFDWHVSSEVLEHIPDTARFFSEAARVVRRGGGVVLTAPFLYRMHPDANADFFRILPGGYGALAARHGLVLERVISNTGVGASCAALINQKLIRDYSEASRPSVRRLLCLAAMPFVFTASNLIGWLWDGSRPDERFASRYLVVLRKP